MSNAFDAEQTARMTRALLQAWAQLKSSGLMNGDGEGVAKGALARAIVEATERGEADERKLVDHALAHYRQSRHAILDRDSLRLPSAGGPGQ